MSSLEKVRHYDRLQQRLKHMPFYIVEYIEHIAPLLLYLTTYMTLKSSLAGR